MLSSVGGEIDGGQGVFGLIREKGSGDFVISWLQSIVSNPYHQARRPASFPDELRAYQEQNLSEMVNKGNANSPATRCFRR